MYTRWNLLKRRHMHPARSLFLMCIILIGFFGFSAYQRNRTWISELSLWSDTCKKTWNKARVFDALGNAYEGNGMYDEAVGAYRKSISLDPRYIKPFNNLGYLYFNRGLNDQAITHYLKALDLFPGYAIAHNNIGNVYLRKGWHESAINHFETAIRLKPDYAEAYLNLGNTYLKKKLYDSALAQYKKALSVRPDYEKARRNIEAVSHLRYYGDRAEIELAY